MSENRYNFSCRLFLSLTRPLISLGAGVVLISAAFGPMIQACVTDYGRLNDLPVIAGASVGSVGILPFGNANPNELVKRGNCEYTT